MHNYIKFFFENTQSVPLKIVIVLMTIFAVMQAIGEVMEFFGRVAPEYLKIRKYFSRKKAEREETAKTLKDVQKLLGDVNDHYSADNIAKRDSWMQWVNSRAEVYDKSIVDLNETMEKIACALTANTQITEEMFIQNSRDRIIDFASKASTDNALVTREEFNRIFKVYDKYENFIAEHKMTNGEVDIAIGIIRKAYEDKLRAHKFFEDVQ